jgi:hypothetical protein
VSSMSASVLRFDRKNDKGCSTIAKADEDQVEMVCQPVSLLAFIEGENRELRRAVIDLALDTLLLREALRKGCGANALSHLKLVSSQRL